MDFTNIYRRRGRSGEVLINEIQSLAWYFFRSRRFTILTCYRTVCEFQTVVAYRGQRSVYCGYSGSDCRFITQENSIDKHVG
jgi:hypothetical protein